MSGGKGGGRAKATPKGRGRSLPDILTFDEIDRLVRRCGTPEDLAFVLVGLFGGLRIAEICNLRPRDLGVDVDAVFVDSGKGDKDRWAPVTAVTVQLLRILAGDKGEDERIFERTPRTYQRRVKDMAAAADIRKRSEVTPHTLRHTCATMQLDLGVDLETVRNNLGHEKLSTTGTYLHLNIRSRSRKYKDAMRTVL